MNCPACERELEQKAVGPVELDVCKGGCGGIWFDNYELDKMDEKHEHLGEELLAIEKGPAVQVDHARKRRCPRCADMHIGRSFWSVKQEVEIDECPSCGGVWLDTGELAAIRSMFPTEEARRKAGKEHFSAIFGKHLRQMRDESEEKARKAHRFARIFRFLCPSWYIPGKQDWGAF
jgi:Zn-finger nucleic acid-binding protein